MNLNQVTLPSSNIPVSIEFYKKFGLKPIVISDHYARFEMPNGSSTFSVSLKDGPTDSSIKTYFEVEDLKKVVLDLEAKGISFAMQPKLQSWMWEEALVKDPDDNVIILYTAGINRKFPPWRI